MFQGGRCQQRVEKVIYGVQEEAVHRYALLRTLLEAAILTKSLVVAWITRHTTEEPIDMGLINNCVNSTFKIRLFSFSMKDGRHHLHIFAA